MFVVLKKRKVVAIVFALIICMVLVITVSSPNVKSVFSSAKKELPIYRVDTDKKQVAISFDCAWGVDYTDKLLEIMQSEKVKCTFFTVQFWAEKYPEYLKKIDQLGHEIGTHSATHPHMSTLNKSQILEELNTSINAIEKVTGKKVKVFRPPFGEYNDLLIKTARELGLYTIQWDVDSLDWKNLSAEQIENRVIKRVKNGSIVLFHNQGLHTAEALKNIIVSLKNEGYEFVTIGELIYKDNYKILPDGTQTKIEN